MTTDETSTVGSFPSCGIAPWPPSRNCHLDAAAGGEHRTGPRGDMAGVGHRQYVLGFAHIGFDDGELVNQPVVGHGLSALAGLFIRAGTG